MRQAEPGIDFRRLESCRVCGADRAAFRRVMEHVPDLETGDDRYAILVCGRCGVGATDPFPSAATIHLLYEGGTSSDYEFPDTSFLGRLKDRLARSGMRRIAHQAGVIPKNVLDFGTGAGRYASAMLHAYPGANVTGSDFAAHPPSGSYYELEPALRYLPHDDLIADERRYDFIIVRHVLEHLHDPVAAIRRWFSMLSAEGALYVEVPNLNSRTARLLGLRWPLWYVPRHLSHFTRASLSSTFERAGATARIRGCEMPLMSNVLALRAGQSRFDGRFRLPGMALHPVQLLLEGFAGEGTCLSAIARRH